MMNMKANETLRILRNRVMITAASSEINLSSTKPMKDSEFQIFCVYKIFVKLTSRLAQS
jgi:hypothetical protein